MTEETLVTLIILSGAGHIIMSICTLAVPKLLEWKKHFQVLPPLLRQVFWTYSWYIKGVNTSFGIVSIFFAHELAGTSPLAGCINIFIAIYWAGRIGVDFLYFETSTLKGIAKLADQALVVLILLFVIVHALAFAHNVNWM
ncbi:hypothetical protein WSM22_38860 [Cytophagales bacterium WSM2-2]|nr:hypothetical protein WSM22_38860 [Cytophagales bacterium WSM2-2]